MNAARHGNDDAVDAFLAAGAEVNCLSVNRGSAIFYAAMRSVRAVKALVAANADPNILDCKGMSPLYSAVQFGGVDIVRCLLDAGAKVNHDETTLLPDTTPLDLANDLQKEDVINALKERGGLTWWQYRTLSSRYVLRSILPSAEGCKCQHEVIPDPTDDEKDVALLYACMNNKPDGVKKCLADGANVNCCRDGRNPLYIAAGSGYVEIVSILIDAGADIEFTAPNGKTAMQVAAREKHRDVVSFLLAKKNERKRRIATGMEA
jgi:ankyrin repeat protein